jgi:hypothetical protein
MSCSIRGALVRLGHHVLARGPLAPGIARPQQQGVLDRAIQDQEPVVAFQRDEVYVVGFLLRGLDIFRSAGVKLDNLIPSNKRFEYVRQHALNHVRYISTDDARTTGLLIPVLLA